MELLMQIKDRHKEAIHMMILDRYSRQRQTAQIAEQVGVSRTAIQQWKNDEDFQREYQKQLRIYQQDFSEIRLADRKERVKVLSEMFEHIPVPRVSLRMKVLEQIRQEVGDDKIQVEHTVEMKGPNVPPRADSYEEWLKQNQQMQAVVEQLPEADYEVSDA
jgi:transcriptional regulator with XRE-family HTH domain|tara:strand:- start:148 stop:630 length:483 start_codon:yes stop_codon:yes gene_type:complete